MTTEEPQGTIRGEVAARVLDMSLKGARLALGTPLQVGSIHDFALEVDGLRLWVQAEVRHASPADKNGVHEIGVEFVGIDPGDAERLRSFIERSRGR